MAHDKVSLSRRPAGSIDPGGLSEKFPNADAHYAAVDSYIACACSTRTGPSSFLTNQHAQGVRNTLRASMESSLPGSQLIEVDAFDERRHREFLADLEEATAHFREEASVISRARVLHEISDADYQTQFDYIKAEYFQRVEELWTRFEEETLRVARPAGRS